MPMWPRPAAFRAQPVKVEVELFSSRSLLEKRHNSEKRLTQNVVITMTVALIRLPGIMSNAFHLASVATAFSRRFNYSGVPTRHRKACCQAAVVLSMVQLGVCWSPRGHRRGPARGQRRGPPRWIA